MNSSMITSCPCGSGIPSNECCARYHSGSAYPDTPELLMRSRYTAFAHGDAQYLLKTSSAKLASTLSLDDLRDSYKDGQFIKLEVLDAEADTVEFIAYFLMKDKLFRIHERSRFVLENEQWKYDEGALLEHPVERLTRNVPCPCGSGKKFKHCHLKG